MTDELKNLMREQWRLLNREVRERQKAFKNRSSDHGFQNHRKDIAQLEKSMRFYMVGKTRPVRVGEIIVNGLLLNQIIKKMSRVKSYDIKVHEGELVIAYRTEIGEGQFTLYDISKYYGNWPIPESELIP